MLYSLQLLQYLRALFLQHHLLEFSVILICGKLIDPVKSGALSDTKASDR